MVMISKKSSQKQFIVITLIIPVLQKRTQNIQSNEWKTFKDCHAECWWHYSVYCQYLCPGFCICLDFCIWQFWWLYTEINFSFVQVLSFLWISFSDGTRPLLLPMWLQETTELTCKKKTLARRKSGVKVIAIQLTMLTLQCGTKRLQSWLWTIKRLK